MPADDVAIGVRVLLDHGGNDRPACLRRRRPESHDRRRCGLVDVSGSHRLPRSRERALTVHVRHHASDDLIRRLLGVSHGRAVGRVGECRTDIVRCRTVDQPDELVRLRAARDDDLEVHRAGLVDGNRRSDHDIGPTAVARRHGLDREGRGDGHRNGR